MMPDREQSLPRAVRTALVIQAVVIAAALMFAADIYAHKRTESVGGVNIWGYRGPVTRQRQPGEIRIVFVGGARAFSWGAAASESIPATVRWRIMLQTDAPGRPLNPIVAVNLGALDAHAGTYAQTLTHYADLRPDYVCIYDDLGLVAGPASASRTFTLTGYAPALPTVLVEKGMALRYGEVAAGYGAAPPTQTATWRALAGTAISAAGRSLQALDAASPSPSQATYAQAIADAIAAARAVATGVVVAVGPAVSDVQRRNRDAVQAIVAGVQSSRIAFVDLTIHAELASGGVTLDGYNYNGDGRARVAEAIAPVLLQWIEQSRATAHPLMDWNLLEHVASARSAVRPRQRRWH